MVFLWFGVSPFKRLKGTIPQRFPACLGGPDDPTDGRYRQPFGGRGRSRAGLINCEVVIFWNIYGISDTPIIDISITIFHIDELIYGILNIVSYNDDILFMYIYIYTLIQW